MTTRDWVVIVAIGILFGMAFPINEVLLREIGPVSISFFRVSLGALAVWAVILLRRVPLRLSGHQILSCLIFGSFMFALPLTIFPLSQNYITGGMAGIVNAMTPIAVVIVSHVWPGGERANWFKAIGVILGFGGIVLLTLPSLRADSGSSEVIAICVALLAPTCYAIALNYLRRLSGLDIAVVVAVSMTGAALLVTPVMLALEGIPRPTEPLSLASLALVGPVLTGWAFLSALWMTRRVGATASSTLTFVAPVSAVLVGVLGLGEEVRAVQVAGMGVIFLGLLTIDGRIFAFSARPHAKPETE
ncbi:MAG: DMT family transporter [Pseudomonadota bacterium]